MLLTDPGVCQVTWVWKHSNTKSVNTGHLRKHTCRSGHLRKHTCRSHSAVSSQFVTFGYKWVFFPPQLHNKFFKQGFLIFGPHTLLKVWLELWLLFPEDDTSAVANWSTVGKDRTCRRMDTTISASQSMGQTVAHTPKDALISLYKAGLSPRASGSPSTGQASFL